jgi:hypothetical protein
MEKGGDGVHAQEKNLSLCRSILMYLAKTVREPHTVEVQYRKIVAYR